MANKEKGFNIKIYAVISFIAVAAALLVICVLTFNAKYTAFHPEKVAEGFVATIVSGGDGYNAYKNTVLSKNDKYGDFIRKNYIEPVVTRDGKNYSDDSVKGEKTLGDDGSLSGELIEKMYPVYEELINKYGWDDYDSIFSGYIERLIAVREELFGDSFFNDEVFFSTFEANVSRFSELLTGTDEVFDENTGVKLSDECKGIYEELYGEDYRFIIAAENIREEDTEDYKKTADTEKLLSYGVKVDDIDDVLTVTVKVSESDTVLAVIDVTLLKIGRSYYVDNTKTDTSALYTFYVK